EKLPPSASEELLEYLGSDSVRNLPEAERLSVWIELADLAGKHRRFSDAGWAMKRELVDRISALARLLAPDAPAFRHQRLFREHDPELYDGKGNYEEKAKELEGRRER